jgi:hypothetical protein
MIKRDDPGVLSRRLAAKRKRRLRPSLSAVRGAPDRRRTRRRNLALTRPADHSAASIARVEAPRDGLPRQSQMITRGVSQWFVL